MALAHESLLFTVKYMTTICSLSLTLTFIFENISLHQDIGVFVLFTFITQHCPVHLYIDHLKFIDIASNVQAEGFGVQRWARSYL